MKVLLVNGSPRKNGCTNRALKEVANALNDNGVDTEIFWIGKDAISGCTGCRSCIKKGECVFNDVNMLRNRIAESDGFVFGSPVYYASANGNLISFMDRLFYSTPKKYLMYKPAASVVSARRAGTTATFDILNKYFSICQMPIISSSYWNMVHGNTPEEVERDEEGLYTMRVLGRNMAYFIKSLKIAKDSGLEYPVLEEAKRTNFIR